MPLSDLINVTVNLQAPGVTAAGFGVLLLLSNTGNAWATPELTRDYAEISDVEADFATTTVEYQAANEYFGQSPRPQRLIIGKGPTKPTMVQTLSISSVVVGGVYKVNAYAGGVLQQASYTAVASAAWTTITAYATGFLLRADTDKLYICITAGTSSVASPPTGTSADITDGTVHWMYAGVTGAAAGAQCNDAIVYNLVKQLNALAAPDIGATSALTGSAGSKIVTCTGDAAGNWFALEPLASGDPATVSNLMALAETTTDPGVAADLTALKNANADWYGLGLLFKSPAIVTTAGTGAAAWTEANQKLMVVAPVDTTCATAAYALGGADVCNKVKDGAWARTHAFYHPRGYEFADIAKMGRFLPTNPGSDNWRMKSFAGVVAVKYTPTQRTNLIAKNAGFYYPLGANSNALSVDGGDGKTGSGEYIDVTRFIDWWVANTSADFVNLEYNVGKIPFTDDGVASIKNILELWNARGIVAGGIAAYPKPTVTGPAVSTVPAGDKTARHLGLTSGFGLTAAFTLAGAINKLSVTANVTQ